MVWLVWMTDKVVLVADSQRVNCVASNHQLERVAGPGSQYCVVHHCVAQPGTEIRLVVLVQHDARLGVLRQAGQFVHSVNVP
jgi:hypothetical protein